MIINVNLLSKNKNYKYEVKVDDNNLNTIKNIIFKKSNILPENQIWYFNSKKLDYTFNFIKGTYNVYNNEKQMISLQVNINGKIIRTPYIPNDIKIIDLLNILSFKDSIYFNNIILHESKTLKYYNVENNNILHIKPIIRVEY